MNYTIILLLIILLLIFYLSNNGKEYFDLLKKNKITFIIPTIGRDTLINSIQSLLNQTNKNWEAIIIFDGIEPNIEVNDERIKVIRIDKKGRDKNSAGLVRNIGIQYVKTNWIGYLDDDDYLANDYIDCFYNELNLNHDMDVLIFRMNDKNKILPELETDNFYLNHVGISFAMKKKIFDNKLIFVPSSSEDFEYLNLMRNNNYKIIISPYIKYFVRSEDMNNNQKGNRVKINF
jgi:glycosyltransferase involved in cell wall biosynthesis